MDRSVSFSVYNYISYSSDQEKEGWSKKKALTGSYTPSGYVVITLSETLPPAPSLIQLTKAAGAVPLIFACVSSTGVVLLQEFTNADLSISWI